MNNIGKKKDSYIQNILNRVNTVHKNAAELEFVLKRISSEWHSDPAPIHEFYRERFNLVDILDRYGAEVEEHHGNQNWKSKMLLTIMHFFTFNSWVCYALQKYEMWTQYRANLASKLATYNTQ